MTRVPTSYGFSSRTRSVLPTVTVIGILFVLSVPVGVAAYIGFLKVSSLSTHVFAHAPPAVLEAAVFEAIEPDDQVRTRRASVAMPDARHFRIVVDGGD